MVLLTQSVFTEPMDTLELCIHRSMVQVVLYFAFDLASLALLLMDEIPALVSYVSSAPEHIRPPPLGHPWEKNIKFPSDRIILDTMRPKYCFERPLSVDIKA